MRAGRREGRESGEAKSPPSSFREEYPMGGIRPSPSKKTCASSRSCWEGGDRDSTTGSGAGLTRVVKSINIKLMTKEEKVTQQMIQHLILVPDSLEDRVLIKLVFQETILVPESKRLWVNVILKDK